MFVRYLKITKYNEKLTVITTNHYDPRQLNIILILLWSNVKKRPINTLMIVEAILSATSSSYLFSTLYPLQMQIFQPRPIDVHSAPAEKSKEWLEGKLNYQLLFITYIFPDF